MNKEVIIDIENPKDNDLISRQAVINAIENDCMRGGLGSCFTCYNDAQAFRGEIEKLPSVNVRQSGEWIRERFPHKDVWMCSECGRGQLHQFNFCPNCGARMVKEEGAV